MTCIKSSPDLLKFYRAWLEWALGDNHEHVACGGAFTPKFGLCTNVIRFGRKVDNMYIYNELHTQFEEAGLDPCYPFGEEEYEYAVDTYAQHENYARLQWVRDRIKDGS